MYRNLVLLPCWALRIAPAYTPACTSVGFAGSSLVDGGTLIAKNRDAPSKGYQRLGVFRAGGR